MRYARGLSVALALAAIAAGSAGPVHGQDRAWPDSSLASAPGAILRPRGALTVGLGMTHSGLGAVAEVYLARTNLSALLGAGMLPSWGGTYAVVSAGLRAYAGASSSRLYVEGVGSYLAMADDDDLVYGPAVLVGFSHVARGGFTFNVALGAGRTTGGTLGPAFDIGVGFTWR